MTPHELFQLSAKAILFNFSRDKILLLHNSRGWWTIPGGHLETGEQPINTARREIREELGLDFQDNLELKAVDKYYPAESLAKKGIVGDFAKTGKIDLYFVGELDETTPIDIAKSGDGLDRFEWAEIAKILDRKYEDWLPRLVREVL